MGDALVTVTSSGDRMSLEALYLDLEAVAQAHGLHIDMQLTVAPEGESAAPIPARGPADD